MTEMRKIIESAKSFSFPFNGISTYSNTSETNVYYNTFLLTSNYVATKVFRELDNTVIEYPTSNTAKIYRWSNFCEKWFKKTSSGLYQLKQGDKLQITFYSNKEYLSNLNSLRPQTPEQLLSNSNLYVLINNKRINLTYKDNLNTQTKKSVSFTLTSTDALSFNQLAIQIYGVRFDRADWSCVVTYIKGESNNE